MAEWQEISARTRQNLEAILNSGAYYSGFHDAIAHLLVEMWRMRGAGRSIEEFLSGGEWWRHLSQKAAYIAAGAAPGFTPVHVTNADGFVKHWTELRYTPSPILATITEPLEPGSVVQISDANGVPIWYRVEFCNRRPDGSVHDVGLVQLVAP